MRRSDFAGPADLREMQRMCSRLWSPSSRFHPGQLAWNHYSSADAGRLGVGVRVGLRVDEAISLWREGADVVGFGWAESADWLELQVDPARPGVAEAVLDWFEEWSDAEEQSIHVMEHDASESVLATAGFVPDPTAGHFVHHVLDLARLGPASSVPGCALRPVTGREEAGARAACHTSAWSDTGPSPVTEAAYAALMTAWPYRPDLDWVAATPDGSMVASCLVWLDPETGVGLVEPVGCVPGHRRRGLARAVTLAALHRLRDEGGRTAVVTTRGDAEGPTRLYASLGFRPSARTVAWSRSLGLRHTTTGTFRSR